MATETKSQAYAFDFDVDSQDTYLQSRVRMLRVLDSIRIGITSLALLMGLSILGVSADTLAVYNKTNVGPLLPLWPDDFNLKPTVALVVGSTVVFLVNLVSLVFSKVRYLRSMTPVHTSIIFAAPLAGLVAALVAMVWFYAVNASDSTDTLLSWTCRWEAVAMTRAPHWRNMCRESLTGVYLSILLIPVETAILAVAGYQMTVEKHTSAYARAQKRSPSPVVG